MTSFHAYSIGIISVNGQVVEASIMLLEDARAFGKVVMVHMNGRLYEWLPPKGNLKQVRGEAAAAGGRLPS